MPSGASDRGSRGGPSSGEPWSRRIPSSPTPTAPATRVPRDGAIRPAPPARCASSSRKRSASAGPVAAPPYQTASNSSVAAANDGAASGWRAATSRAYSPAVRPACSAMTPWRTRSATRARYRHRSPSAHRPCPSSASASCAPLPSRTGELHHHLGLGARREGGNGDASVAHEQVDHRARPRPAGSPTPPPRPRPRRRGLREVGELLAEPVHDPIGDGLGRLVVARLAEDLVGEVADRLRVVLGRREAHQVAGKASPARSSRSSPSVRTRRSR